MGDYQQQYQRYFDEVEQALQGLFHGQQPYDRLQEAMRPWPAPWSWSTPIP